MDRITFTPKFLETPDEPELTTRFFIRLAPILDRDRLDAELEGTFRAAEVAPFQLRDIAVERLNGLLGESDAAELIALVNAQYGGEKLGEREAGRLKAAIEVLAEQWPAYRAAREQEARRNRILPTLAFVRWCDGWEHLTDKDGNPIPYQRDKDGIPDETLRTISPLTLRVVGIEAYRQQYGQGQAGN